MEYPIGFIGFVTALLVLIVGIILARIVSNILKKLFIGIRITFFDKNASKHELEKSLASLIKWAVYIVSIIFALIELGISIKVIEVAVIVFIFILILFTFLAFKDWLPNIATGLYIKRTNKLKKGDVLIIKGLRGIVLNFNIVETKLITEKGEIVYIPNSLLSKEKAIVRGRKK